MTWSGEYVLILVCDSEVHQTGRQINGYTGRFTAESSGAARNAARRAGWLVGVRSRHCLCPDCRVNLFTQTDPKRRDHE